MKKLKFALLALTAISLMGCGGGTASSTAPESSVTPTSEKTSSGKQGISSAKESVAPASSEKESEAPISSKEDSSAPESSEKESEAPASSEKESSSPESSAEESSAEESSIPASSEGSSEEETSTWGSTTGVWSDDVKDTFSTYFDSHEIPFFYIGNDYPTVNTNYWSYYTEIDYQSNSDWNDQIATDAETVLLADGWTFEASDSTTTGTYLCYVYTKTMDDGCKIKIKIKYSPSYGCLIEVYYTEKFDPTADTEWEDDTKSTFNTYLGTEDIPYVYLGTADESAYYYSSYSAIRVTGGKWDDQITTLAETAFGDAGWTVSTETKSSSFDVGPMYMYGDVTTATYSDDTYTYTVYVGHDYSGNAYMVIVVKEAYNAAGFTAWPADVETNFRSYMDGHDIPLAYLGTNNPTSTWNSSRKTLNITGGTWDDQILSDGVQTFTDAGWTVSAAHSTTSTESYTSSSPYYYFKVGADCYSATYTFDDNCTITAYFGQYWTSSYYGYMELSIDAPFSVPEDITDWTDDMKDTYLDVYFPGLEVPYVYLASKNPAASWSSSYNSLKITGGEWDDQITDLAEDAFEDAGWEYETKTLSSSFDAGPCYLYDTLTTATYEDDTYSYTIYIGHDYYDNTIMVIHRKDVFNPDADDAWESTTQTIFDTYLTTDSGTAEIPYVYMGTTTETATYNSYYSAIKITGGEWDDQITDVAEAAFEDAGWEYSSTTKSGSYDVGPTYLYGTITTATYSDGTYDYTVYVGHDYYGDAIMVVRWKNAFDPTAGTAWLSTTTDLFAQYFGTDTDIPYVYLSTDSETTYYSSYYSSIQITGGDWDDRMTDLAESAFSDAGWTVSSSTKSSSYDVGPTYLYDTVTTATFSDDTYSYTVYIGHNYSGKAIMVVHWTILFDPTSDNAWETTTTDTLTSSFGTSDVPYVYLGTTTETAAYSEYYSTVKITGGEWNDQIIDLAKDAYDEAGWEYNTTVLSSSFDTGPCYLYGTLFTATYSDGTYDYTVYVGHDYSGNAILVIRATEAFNGDADTAWESTTQDLIDTNLGTGVLPYVYLGTTTETATWTEDVSDSAFTYLTINGGYWNDDVYDLFEEAFEGAGWVIATEDTPTTYNHQTEIATYSDGTYNYTAYLCANYSGKIVLKVYKTSVIDFDAVTEDAWNTTTQANIDSVGTDALPYLNLGSTNYTSSYSSSSGTTITGEQNVWDNAIVDEAADTLDAEGWDVTVSYDSDGNKKLTGYIDAGDDDDAYQYKVTIECYDDWDFDYSTYDYLYYSEAKVTLKKVPKFNSDNALGEWPEDVEEAIENICGGNTIPYFYFGDLNATTPYSSYTTEIDLHGTKDCWSDEIFTLAEEAFDDDGGWTISYTTDSYYGKTMTATKTLDDGSVIKVKIFASSYYGAMIEIYYTEP